MPSDDSLLELLEAHLEGRLTTAEAAELSARLRSAEARRLFWQYAEHCVERGMEYTGPITPDFSEETAAFFRQDLRQYESLVSRLLQERLAMPND